MGASVLRKKFGIGVILHVLQHNVDCYAAKCYLAHSTADASWDSWCAAKKKMSMEKVNIID
jgi:hypothetical protein